MPLTQGTHQSFHMCFGVRKVNPPHLPHLECSTYLAPQKRQHLNHVGRFSLQPVSALPDVLIPRLFIEPDVVAIESVRELAQVQQVLLQRTSDRGLKYS
jgi:hypothetical protein